MKNYFDLCSEEYWLRKKGIIKDDLWKLWKKGLKFELDKKTFRDGWKRLREEGYDEDFKRFIDDLVQEAEARAQETSSDKTEDKTGQKNETPPEKS